MTEARRPPALRRRTLLLAAGAAAAALPVRAQQRVFTLGYLTQGDDERYRPSVLQKGFPDAPSGRSQAAAQIALNDSAVPLRLAGWSSDRVLALQAANAAGVPAAIQQLRRQGVHHVVLALPAEGVAAAASAAAGKDMILFNAAAPEDALRGERCAPHLLHTLPSRAMQMDALAQLLVARKWVRTLVLVGPTPADALLLAAWQRSAHRFGIEPVAQKSFRPAGDARERDAANVRLLTAGDAYDAVVVLDAQGEFAQLVPYQGVLPRPVLGSNGLTAQAWHALWDRDGAPQLSRRFLRKAARPMDSYDWASWISGRAAAQVASAFNKASIAQQLDALRQGAVGVDGCKGQRLTFRAWDGQLRQPLLLAYGTGVAETAPLEGFVHPRSALDTLGYDASETGCTRPGGER